MPAAAPAAGPAAVEWRYDPWTDARGAAIVAALMVVALPAGSATAGLGGPALAIAALGVFASLAPGFVPTTCRIDEGGVSWRLGALPRSFRPWVRIGRVHVGRRGVRFDPCPRGVLARLRAVALPLPAAAPPALRDAIDRWAARHAD